jgi:ribosomal protein S25
MKPHPIPGFKACWQERRLSDITVLIIEKGFREQDPEVQLNKKAKKEEARLGKREVAKHIIPCSKTLLAGQAEYFRTQLLSDLDDGGTGDVSLVVEEGEADAALAVLKALYMGIADDLPTAELVTMWRIADRLQAANTAAMCVEALCAKEFGLGYSLDGEQAHECISPSSMVCAYEGWVVLSK